MPSSTPDDFDNLTASGTDSQTQAAEITGDGANRAQLAALEHQGLNGARWFYWIAALSLVNSVIQLAGADRHFIVGLGSMQIVNGIAEVVAQQKPDFATVAHGVGLGINIFAAAIVAMFGWLSTRRYTAAFIIGMALYLLDALVCLLILDFLSAGFHGFVLYCIWSGLSAYRKLGALEAESAWAGEGQLAPAVE